MVMKGHLIYLILGAVLIFIQFNHLTFGMLTDNGICTNGKITIGNDSKILNQSSADFLKNLTMDNRPMAEIICDAMLNNTN